MMSGLVAKNGTELGKDNRQINRPRECKSIGLTLSSPSVGSVVTTQR